MYSIQSSTSGPFRLIYTETFLSAAAIVIQFHVRRYKRNPLRRISIFDEAQTLQNVEVMWLFEQRF